MKNIKLFENFDINENENAVTDKFWDENWEALIKYIDDNHEMIPDHFAALGLDQESIDAEMDGTSKQQAITLMHLYNNSGKGGLDDLKGMITGEEDRG